MPEVDPRVHRGKVDEVEARQELGHERTFDGTSFLTPSCYRRQVLRAKFIEVS